MNYQRIFVLGLFILNIQKIRGEMGGVIIEDISLKNDILIEDHTRTIDDYFIAQRCIDTFCIKNIGESVIKGVFIPEHNIQHLSYYDDLGSIHKKIFRNSMFLLGFRYPVKPNERISFSVETIYKGTKKAIVKCGHLTMRRFLKDLLKARILIYLKEQCQRMIITAKYNMSREYTIEIELNCRISDNLDGFRVHSIL